jgi:uncharacterized BrkB/YihY/UPF0761 family membrane protein
MLILVLELVLPFTAGKGHFENVVVVGVFGILILLLVWLMFRARVYHPFGGKVGRATGEV